HYPCFQERVVGQASGSCRTAFPCGFPDPIRHLPPVLCPGIDATHTGIRTVLARFKRAALACRSNHHRTAEDAFTHRPDGVGRSIHHLMKFVRYPAIVTGIRIAVLLESVMELSTCAR